MEKIYECVCAVCDKPVFIKAEFLSTGHINEQGKQLTACEKHKGKPFRVAIGIEGGD